MYSRVLQTIYNNEEQEVVQEISVEHTRKILGGRIELMFYDVTTLYFQTAPDNDMRQAGFSKDGKTAEAQIVLGLLVSTDGYPLAYSIFNGSQYEGYTMIPIIDEFVRKFSVNDFVIVADSGLMNSKNIKLLRDAGYKYVLGARIRNESTELKEWILSLEKIDSAVYENISREYVEKGTGEKKNERIVVSYSENRAKKDQHNREKGVERLEKAYKTGRLTKDKVNKRGYNKFLDISKDVSVSINRERIQEDAEWDGLKGYITNTDLSPDEVITQYHGLWVVERAFRIGKSNLEMRPIFHFTERRIEAHICICFVAYKVYKELQRRLPDFGIKLSVDKVLKIAKTIPTLYIRMTNGTTTERTLFLTDEQRLIKPLFDTEMF